MQFYRNIVYNKEKCIIREDYEYRKKSNYAWNYSN